MSPAFLRSIIEDGSVSTVTRDSAKQPLALSAGLMTAVQVNPVRKQPARGFLDHCQCTIDSMGDKKCDAPVDDSDYAPLPGINLRTSNEPLTEDESVTYCLKGIQQHTTSTS